MDSYQSSGVDSSVLTAIALASEGVSETMDGMEFLASGPEVSVEVSVDPVRKQLRLLQQRTRCSEIRTFMGF